MRKDLVIDFERCTGCRICEMACSLRHKKVCSPALSAIHIIRWEKEGLNVPMVCQQCETAFCEAICPVEGALNRHPETGAIVVMEERCIGCRMCIAACPFGGSSLDPDKRKIIKCDLCEGDPSCVIFCEPQALQYLPATTQTYLKKKVGAEKLAELITQIVRR